MLRRKIILFVLIPCLLAIGNAFGQMPNYVHYQVKDGLPSAEVYDVLCDSKGYIWVATDRGVSRYNGYEFENFTTNDGLTNNTNFRIYEDYMGRVWFLAYDASICYYQNGNFHSHPLNESLQSIAVEGTWWEEIIVQKNNSIELFERNSGHPKMKGTIMIDAQWSTAQLVNHNDGAKVARFSDGFNLMHSQSRDAWSFHLIHAGKYSETIYCKTLKEPYKSDGLILFPGYQFETEYRAKLLRVSGNSLDNQYSPKNITHSILALEQHILLCTTEGLVILDSDSFTKEKILFPGINISQAAIDKEGNLWISSLSKGLFKVPSLNVFSIANYENGDEIGQIHLLESFRDQLVFSGSSKDIKIVKEDYTFSTIQTYQDFTPRKLNKYKDRPLLYRYRQIRWIEDVYDLKLLSEAVQSAHYALTQDSIFLYSTGAYVKLAKVDLSRNKFFEPIKYLMTLNEAVVDIVFSEQAEGFIATLSKIYQYNLSLESPQLILNVPAGLRISDLQMLGDRDLVFSTLGNGLSSLIDGKYHSYAAHPKISSEFINSVFLENDSTLWLATTRGADRISFTRSADSLKFQTVDSYASADGLLSDYINTITSWRGQIVVGSDQGLSFFDPEKIQKEFDAPHLALIGMNVNGQAFPMDSTKSFNYAQSNIAFKYSSNAMRQIKGSPRYHYRLVSKDDEVPWTATNLREVQFANLSAGEYSFQVKAANTTGNKYSAVQNVTFTIKPHFTKSWWFIGSILLLGLGAIYLYYRSRILRIKRNTELEKIEQKYLLEVNAAQLAALRSQMNPHFIFNSLNSIQNFIFKNDVRQANHFLAKFSRLIRESLVLSKLELIPLTQELNFLKDYLELEQMRFPDVFDFSIKIDPSLDKDELMIPPLLIQPILENSIRHGFKGLQRKGEIKIHISDQNDTLKISIKDNGIGMTAARKIKNPNSKHISFATKILSDRLHLINERFEESKATFESFERQNEEGAVKGVTSIINLPQF